MENKVWEQIEQEFDELWVDRFYEIPIWQLKREIKTFLHAQLLAAEQGENNAWMSNERCEECGGEMEPNPTCSTCLNCLENG